MRIAIFTETFLPKWDGIATTLYRLLEYLERNGHQCLMFAPDGAPAYHAGTPIIPQASIAMPFYKDLKLAAPRRNLREQLRDFAPDIVHLVNPTISGHTGLSMAAETGVPVVMSYHTDLPGYLPKYGMSVFREGLWLYLRWLHNRADLTVCPSRYTQAELIGRGFERVEIWSRGVDAALFHPDKRSFHWRERLTDGHPEAPLLIYAGRLAVEKDIRLLRPVLDALPQVRLAILGGGPQRRELQRLFACTQTHFTGHLSTDDLACAYAAGDIFAFPAAQETFGSVVLEAMASGLPVVAADRGGPVDHVLDGHNGYLFNHGDPDCFIARLRPLVEDAAYRAELAGGARFYALGHGWNDTFDALMEHYEKLVATRDLAAVMR